MSYILDALRKADAERERDPARGIHAQPLRPVEAGSNASWRRPALIAGGLALVGVAAVATLWRPAPATLPAPVSAVQAVPNRIPAAAPAPAVVLQPPPPPMPAPPPTVTNRAAPAAPVARAAPAPAPTPAARVPASAPAERILSMAEAPPEVQRLAISGGVYSDNAAQRMLIVGGQVVNEGAELAPGIVLEQIRPKSAVVRVRGQRVAVPY